MTTDIPVGPPPPPLPIPPPVNRRRWWIHFILIGGYFAAAIPIGLIHQPQRATLFSNTKTLLIASIFEIVIFSLVFGLACLASRASVDDLLLRWRQGWWTAPLGVVYSIAMRIALGIIVLCVVAFLMATKIVDRDTISTLATNTRTPVERMVNVSAMQHDRAYFWLTVTLASFVVAGLREELWRSGTLAAMRKLWPNQFANRSGQIAAVALIAIIFGLGHLSLGPIAAAMACVLGLLLGIIMVLHESIWPAVIAHGMFDATSFALIPIVLHQTQHIR